jgi:two-component system cell cycle response regulator DivK
MAEQKKNAAPKEKDRKNRFLLILDSDPERLAYLSKLLQRFDYHVFTATSATEAVDALTTAVPSLILTSLDLKDIDGLKFMQTIKKSPELSAVPFIALTKQGDLVEETRSFLQGAVDCLSQPVAADLLYRSVQTIMESTPRTSIRVRALFPVMLTGTPHGASERMCALDLSEQGLFVSCDQPAEVHARLNLLINLNGRHIPVEAEVLRTYKTGDGPFQESGMGLGFVKIAPEDQECIRQYIMEDITRGIEPKKK